jgi:hypothetical protein
LSIILLSIPKADVASSSKRILGFEINARAMATKITNKKIDFSSSSIVPRCFCPPLSLSPDDVL